MKKFVIVFIVLAAAGVAWLTFIANRLDGGEDLDPTRIASLFVRESMNVPFTVFRIHVGRFPTTEEGLDALIRCPPSCELRWKGPYIQNQVTPEDPWGRLYQYQFPGTHNPKTYDLWSLGPDGVPSDDDIGNWEK